MKKIFKYFAIISTASLIAANLALAEQSANLQQSFNEIKQSVQEVKEGTKNLITAKESENLTPEEKAKQELSLRLDILAKILNLSIKEAEDAINQLKALNNLEEKNISLRDQFIEKFEGFLKFYDKQKNFLEKPEEIDLAKIKEMAQSFKDWREKIYLPEFRMATDFLLINQQKAAIEMAENRFKKISLDIEKLKKNNLKGVDQLEKLLELAANSLNKAKNSRQKARDEFWILVPTLNLTTTSTSVRANSTSTTASTTDTVSSSTIEETISPIENAENTSSTTSSSTIVSSSTPSIEIEDQFLSIKSLIGESLNKIKETYQIFIEMSNFVKKLLI